MPRQGDRILQEQLQDFIGDNAGAVQQAMAAIRRRRRGNAARAEDHGGLRRRRRGDNARAERAASRNAALPDDAADGQSR